MKVTIATEADSPRLKTFFHQFILGGSVDLKIERPQSFFAPYQIQSDRFCTFLLEDESEILGCVTFVIQEVILGDKKQTIA